MVGCFTPVPTSGKASNVRNCPQLILVRWLKPATVRALSVTAQTDEPLKIKMGLHLDRAETRRQNAHRRNCVMKSTWRVRVSKRSAFLACALSVVCGCQTWSPSNWGVPAGTRVPPPPTGSYQHQGAYYNNPSTGTPASPPVNAASSPAGGTTAAPGKTTSQNIQTAFGGAPVMQASAVSPMNSSSPRTQFSAASDAAFSAGASSSSRGSSASAGNVSTAGYTDNGSGMAEVVSANSLQAQPDIDPRLQNGSVQIGASSTARTYSGNSSHHV